jgi:hypothetical protein
MDGRVSTEAIAVDAAVRIGAHAHVSDVSAVESIGITEAGRACSEFVVTLDNGQRFNIAVTEGYSDD